MPRKILLLINYLLLSFQIKCENIFFISKSNKNNLTYCVTDSEYAINWINSNLKEISQVSNYVPDPAKSIQVKTEGWFSRWNFSNDVILDRRWEELKIIVVNNSNYTPLFKSLHVNFDILFSVLADDIQMFLCDGRSVSQSSCYWFSLENFNGTTKATSRQCRKSAIIFPNSEHKACRTNQNRIEDLFQSYISNSYWSHFKLSKRNNVLSLDYFNRSRYNRVLKYIDLNPDLSELIVHTKSSHSFWKIHEGEYLHTATEGSNIFWKNFPLLNDKNEICVTFYYLMCKFCRLKLILKREEEIVTTKTYDDNTSKWSNIKFFAEHLPLGNYTLLLTTIGTVKNKEYFWVIDEIRECRKKEFRIIQSFEGTQCQLMSHPANVISIKHSVSRKLNTSFGIEQILFQQGFYDNEENEIKLCSISHFEEETVCSCQKGFYGDTCRNKCECNNKTNQECDDVTGKCFHCPLYYTGTKCDVLLPPIKDLLVASKNESYIYLKWKPSLLSHSQLSHSYQIKLFSGHETLNFTITDSSRCDIWPEYLCYAIDNLKNNTEYTIEIKCWNEVDFERIDTGPTSMTRVITKTEPPDAPYDLKLIWNEENTLILEWKHPNQSNGDILYYTINFPFTNRNYLLKTDSYNLTYHFQVPNIVPSSSQFVVEISAFNGYQGKKLIESGSSPPDIPSLAEKPEISGSPGTIKLSILPKKPLGILKSELYLFVLITGKSDNFSNSELTKFDLNNLKTVMRCNWTMGFGEPLTFIIGNGLQASNCDQGIKNYELKPETNYNVTLVVKNTFIMKNRYKIYSFKCSTTNNGASLEIAFSVTTTLFVLLLITTPLAIYFLRKRRKQQLTENHQNIESNNIELRNLLSSSLPWPQRPPPILAVQYDENSSFSSECSAYYERVDEYSEPDEYSNLPKTRHSKLSSNDNENHRQKNVYENEPDDYNNLTKTGHSKISSNDNENHRGKNVYENQPDDYNNPTKTGHSKISSNDNENHRGKNVYENEPDETSNLFKTGHSKISSNDNENNREKNVYENKPDDYNNLTKTEHSKISSNDNKNHRGKNVYEDKPDETSNFLKTGHSKISSNDNENNREKNVSENESDEYCPQTYRSLLRRESNEIPSHDYDNIGQRDLSLLLTNYPRRSKTILLKDFVKYVNNLRRGDELEQQFNTIFDENSAEYEPTSDSECFDYIDMTYHDGTVIKKAYIATDLSTKGSVEDFWKIIWDDNVRHIILHKGYYEKQEFKKYWPQNNESMRCHGILIKLISSRTLEKFHYRKFLLICNFEMREVDQVQFPYNRLNPRKYVPLFRKMETFSLECDRPILVHSSHGIANVGLILLCDMSLRMAKKENLIDVCKNLQELAKNNIELAGNVVQYGFVHTIISKYLTSEENYDYPEQNYYLNY